MLKSGKFEEAHRFDKIDENIYVRSLGVVTASNTAEHARILPADLSESQHNPLPSPCQLLTQRRVTVKTKQTGNLWLASSDYRCNFTLRHPVLGTCSRRLSQQFARSRPESISLRRTLTHLRHHLLLRHIANAITTRQSWVIALTQQQDDSLCVAWHQSLQLRHVRGRELLDRRDLEQLHGAHDLL